MGDSSSADIVGIVFYDDGVIEIKAQCPACHSVNVHTITHASERRKGKRWYTIELDFRKLGTRMCHNFRSAKNACFQEYALYTTQA